MTAEAATAAGHVVDDPKGKYIESRMICMMWPYDEKGKMIGERVYPAATCTIEKCAEEDFISLEKARAVFDPLIAESRLTEVA